MRPATTFFKVAAVKLGQASISANVCWVDGSPIRPVLAAWADSLGLALSLATVGQLLLGSFKFLQAQASPSVVAMGREQLNRCLKGAMGVLAPQIAPNEKKPAR